MNIKKGLTISAAVVSCILLGWLWDHFLIKPSSPAKTNMLQQVITNRANTLSMLWDCVSIYLGGKYRDTWQPGIQPSRAQKKEQQKLFHHNLAIEHIKDCDPAIKLNPRRPTLFLHGWGDTKNSAKLLKAYCDVLPGDIITFNFRDRGILFPKLKYSSLGQLPDVLQALYVLKWTKDTLNLDAIDLFGYSRGGATTINMIAVLNEKTGIYDADLARIGINAEERAELLNVIQNGSIVLNCPLTDLNTTARFRLKDYAPQALRALATVSKYKLDGLQALDAAKNLTGLKLNILIHYQHNDCVVSNENEAEFYKRLARHNPETTFVVLGNDGGHLHTHHALSRTLHTFRKMFGGSYDPAYDIHYRLYTAHQRTCANKLLQPGLRAESCINSFNTWCKAELAHQKKQRHNFLLFSITQ